jgi:hypothetical protein
MGVIRSGDRSTSEEIDGQILENCIKPWAWVLIDAINEHIIASLGYDGVLKASFVYSETESQKTAKSSRVVKELISGVITENESRKILGYAKSDSKYADMTADERKATINKDLGLNGFNGVGDQKNNYDGKVTDNKLKE